MTMMVMMKVIPIGEGKIDSVPESAFIARDDFVPRTMFELKAVFSYPVFHIKVV